MKQKKERPTTEAAPKVTPAQIDELRSKLGSASQPILRAGAITRCPDCGGRMVTTNNLEKTVATPRLVYVITRLPGAACESCGAVQFDSGAVGAIEQFTAPSLIADYETAVTRASGKTLGTYFKMDLARVLSLKGSEHLYWTVIDRNRALVQIARGHEDAVAEEPTTSKRPRAR